MMVSEAESDRLKVGIVGGGTIAETHVPYIRAAGGDIVAVADLSVVASNDLADRFQIARIHRSVEDLIEVEQPDVVHVLTPPHTHAAIAVAALERGVHALVEKPMALDPAEVDRMEAAAEAGGALLTVDHNRLFDPVMLEARRLVDSGEIGELVAIESYQAGTASERAWLSTLQGGGLGDLVPHPLYLQLAFLGEVKSIQAMAMDRRGRGSVDELRVLMEGEGRSGVLTISTHAVPHLNTLKLCGSKMTIEVNLNNMTLVRRRDYDVPKIIGKPLPNIDESYQLMSQVIANTVNFVRGKIRYYPGMKTLIQRFYDAIRSGEEAPVSIAEGGAVVRVTAEIWDALERNAVSASDSVTRMEVAQ
jgi:predicted dehydrogenase